MASETQGHEPTDPSHTAAYMAGIELARRLAGHNEVVTAEERALLEDPDISQSRRIHKTEHKLHVIGDGEYIVSDEEMDYEENTNVRGKR
jgi:hypothetical protein